MQATAGQREPCGFLFLWAPAVPVKCRGKRGRQGEFPWGCGMPGDGEERSGPGGGVFPWRAKARHGKTKAGAFGPGFVGAVRPRRPPRAAGRSTNAKRTKSPAPRVMGPGGTTDGRKGGGRVPLPPGGLNHLAAGRSRRANPAAVARISPPAQGRRAKPGPMAYGPGRHNGSPRAAAEGRTQPLVRDYRRPRRTAARVGPRVFVRPGRRLRRSRPSP